MAMMPKRVKYRKFHKGRVHGNATRGNTVSYGEFGIQTLEAGRISGHVIEAGRMAATHLSASRRPGVYPDLPAQIDHRQAPGNPDG